MLTVVLIPGWGFFPLVNLPVVLVYGYGRGSCHLDFFVDVCLPDRRWARASVSLLCILQLAGVVGFTVIGFRLFRGTSHMPIRCCIDSDSRNSLGSSRFVEDSVFFHVEVKS